MKLVRRLANLGYGSRKVCSRMIDAGRVTRADGTRLSRQDEEEPGLLIDGQPLDPLPSLHLLLHKPMGLTCSRADSEPTIYGLLPERYAQRRPVLAPVGRLDKDTTGVVLLTDDGALNHRLTSPRHAVEKVYRVTLADPLRGDEGETFASGELLLRSEKTPLRPAVLEVLEATEARLTLTEGRYHQVKRMFAAVGHRVVALHRERLGELALGDLAEGTWRPLTPEEVEAL